MTRIELQKIAGACAILYTILIVAFSIIFLGTEVAEADRAAEFLPLLEEDRELGAIAAALLVIMPLLIAVAGIGFFQMLKHAGSLTWIALFGFVGGGLVIMYRGFTWMAMTLELAPAYVEASEVQKVPLAAIGDTLGVFALGADMVGAVLIGGIGVPIFAVAMLKKNIGPRWVAWLGIFGALVGGWLTLLTRMSEATEFISFIGAIAFFMWMVAAGAIAWRTPAPANSQTQPAV